MKRKLLAGLIVLASLGSAALPGPAPAFDQPPWDTGHQTIDPDPGDKDTDPGDDDCNNSGSPFEVATGNFIYRARDLFIPGLGRDIEITRTYNSRDMRNGPLGRGWTFTYDQRLIETTDQVSLFVICRQGDGKRERFLRNPDGTYTPSPDVFSRLVKHPDGTWTLTDKNGTQRRFDAEGRLSALADRNGNTLTLSYDAAGFLTTLTDAGGRTLTFTKGANGKIASLTDPAGRLFNYAYDADGRLTAFTDPLANTTQYAYDAKHNLTQVIDPRGTTAQQMTYDAQGRVATFTEQGETWTVSYFPDQKKTTKRDSQGNTWTYFSNDNGNITRVLDPSGNTEDSAYDANFNVSGITDRNGNIRTLTYDTRGNSTSITNAAGNVTRLTYEPTFNQVTSVTDPLGNTTRFNYDVKGNLAEITDALGNVTHQMAYDGRGRLISLTDALANIARFSYDVNGNLIQFVDALGNTTSATFDALGNRTSITDAEGRTTQFDYDAHNRLIKVTDALGGITRGIYDANGNLTSVSDAKGNTTTFDYDGFNRLVKVTNPLGQGRTFRYDSKGRPISTTDAKGQTITLSYDALNRVIRKQTADNTISFSYDNVGNLVSVVDDDSTLTFLYDALNRAVQARTGTTPAQPAAVIAYTYDANGNRTSMTDPQGGGTSYTYDALNRLIRLTNPKGESTAYSYSYHALYRRAQVALPNGTISRFNYDAANQLTSLAHQAAGATIARFDYTYDRAGNRVTLTEPTRVRTYAYDALNRLLQATHATLPAPETFSYDPVGNRLLGAGVTANFNAANRLTEDTNFGYAYDANGNLIQKTEKTTGKITLYTYDAENQLIRIDFPDGTFAAYRYDGLGRRIEKNVNGQISRFIYDGEDILLELDATNTIDARYTHGTGIDDPVSFERGGNSFFYHADGLGSITGLTDSTGTSVRSYLYDSFGQIVAQTGTLNKNNPYTYAGREYDPESGLYYYRARMYDPATGRFLQEDPIGYIGSDMNLYAYVLNNPVKWRDPFGLQATPSGSRLQTNFDRIDTFPFEGERRYPVLPGFGRVDMRHVVAAYNAQRLLGGKGSYYGYCGAQVLGLGVEIWQLGGDWESAFNPEDFKSNFLGALMGFLGLDLPYTLPASARFTF